MQQFILLFGDYFKEFFQRFKSRSPQFFRILSTISLIATVLTGLPGIIEEIGTTIGQEIILPDWATVLQNKIVAWASFTSLVIAKLPVNSPAVAQTEGGTTLKATDEKQLPFTAKSEDKAVKKNTPDLPVVEKK